MRNVLKAAVAASLLSIAPASFAAVVTQWNFNSNPADGSSATGTTAPAIGTGTFTALNGIATTYSSGDANGGSSDPTTGSPTDDSGLQTTTYPAQATGSATAGVRFDVSTASVGASDPLYVYFDIRHSNTSSRYVRLDYTTDGTTFIPGTTFEATTGGDTWYNQRTLDLSGVAAAKGNANFGIRIVTVFGPDGLNYNSATANTTAAYAAAGTLRFDMVTVSTDPIPEPATAGLLGSLALVALRRRSR